MHHLYKVIMKKPIEAADIYVLNEKRITKLLCHLLNERSKSALHITFNSKYEDLIKEKLNLMETNPEEFVSNRDAIIHQLLSLEDLTLQANSPLTGSEGHEILNGKIYSMIQASIIDMIFKISTAHLQQQAAQQKVEEEPKPPGDEQHADEPKLEGEEGDAGGGLKKLLLEKTQEEQEILKAKSKILITYHDFSRGVENKSAILRIRIPLNRSSPVKQDESREEEQQNLQKQLLERQDDNFIEPYDGSTYELERLAYEELDPNSAKTKAFNFGLMPDKQFILLDEISAISFSKGFYDLIKTGIREFSLLKLEDFVMLFRKIYKEKEQIQMQEYKAQQYIPIFDYEFFG